MGKQTMGTPVHSFPFRSDGKMYRLQVYTTILKLNLRGGGGNLVHATCLIVGLLNLVGICNYNFARFYSVVF